MSEVSSGIKIENIHLSDIYSEIVGLFADNLIWTMEYIIYLEWGNPEDYEWSVAPDSHRVPFLPDWITNINNRPKNHL